MAAHGQCFVHQYDVRHQLSRGAAVSSSHQQRRLPVDRRLNAASHLAQASSPGQSTSSLDVSNAVVNPSFRSTPWDAEAQQDASRSKARIVFVSESNVCRSVLAEATMSRMLQTSGLADQIELSSRGTRDYNQGEPPEQSAVAVATELGLRLREDFRARTFDYEADTVHFDMILVMDKFTAGDVMREISVYDTINKGGQYTQKVRRLGEFHPLLCGASENDGQDIDDPLYGNVGGEVEMDAVRRAAEMIRESCNGLVQFLTQIREESPDGQLPKLLRQKMQGMQALSWLVPPMLSR